MPTKRILADLMPVVLFASASALFGACDTPMTPGMPPPAPRPMVAPVLENDGSGCAVAPLPAPGTLPVIEEIPDPFRKLDGTRISRRSEWRCRREEIKRQAERYFYGAKPPKPEMVRGTVSATQITVNVSQGGKSTSFTVPVTLPSTGTAPYPVLVSFGFSQNDVVRNEGVAIVHYSPYAVGSEPNASRASKKGAFYDLYGSSSRTGLLVAWAWGVSRIIDVIEQSGGAVLRANRTAVVGCSRFGKGAFVTGAFDQRIALTIPFESGSAGVPIWRGIPAEGAQSAQSAFNETYWLGDDFQPFISNLKTLPIDTHEVVSMIAPRGLLILDNPHIPNLGPRSAHVAALGGAEVYKALGAGDAIAYHSAVASGQHCSARPEFVAPLQQSIRRFLLGQGGAPGVINAAAKARGNLADFRTWSTPALP